MSAKISPSSWEPVLSRMPATRSVPALPELQRGRRARVCSRAAASLPMSASPLCSGFMPEATRHHFLSRRSALKSTPATSTLVPLTSVWTRSFGAIVLMFSLVLDGPDPVHVVRGQFPAAGVDRGHGEPAVGQRQPFRSRKHQDVCAELVQRVHHLPVHGIADRGHGHCGADPDGEARDQKESPAFLSSSGCSAKCREAS